LDHKANKCSVGDIFTH